MSAETADPNEYPAEILLKDLQATHTAYDLAKIEKYEALYEGGKKFHDLIDQFLVKLQMEEAAPEAKNQPGYNPKSEGSGVTQSPKLQGAGGFHGKQYTARKKRAWYCPVVAGIIDFMAAAVSQNPPNIVTSKPADPKASLVDKVKNVILRLVGRKDEAVDETSYWHTLNRDADGLGTDLPALGWQALIEGMVQKRSYLYVIFPEVTADNLADQEAKGGLDAKIGRLTARDVNDWQTDKRGALTMVRTYSCEHVRSNPWVQPDSKRHTWVYFTAQAVYQYVLVHKNDEEPNPESQMVTRVTANPHDLGRLPVVPVRNDIWPMERLYDSAVALFNRETAATWSLDRLAYAMMVLYTEKDLGEVVTDQALLLNPGSDKAEILAPPAHIFAAQQADIERWKESLFLAIQAMVLLAAAKDEQGRQSGVAKQRDFGSLSTLLAAFASPLKDALEEVVEMIQEFRDDDDVALAIQGLDNFDVQSLELKLKNTASLLNLPMPDAARNWAILDAALAACANAPSEVREQIVNEVMAGKIQDAHKVDQADTRQANTQKVKPVEKAVA